MTHPKQHRCRRRLFIGSGIPALICAMPASPLSLSAPGRRTPAALAEKAGLPLRSVQNWEISHREPRIDGLKRLARALGGTVDRLIADVVAGDGAGDRAADAGPKRATRKPRKVDGR
jgi:transcriptional regulator with XRE-family HTH domain